MLSRYIYVLMENNLSIIYQNVTIRSYLIFVSLENPQLLDIHILVSIFNFLLPPKKIFFNNDFKLFKNFEEFLVKYYLIIFFIMNLKRFMIIF